MAKASIKMASLISKTPCEYSYSIEFVYLLFLVAVFTDIASAIHYCSYYPKQTHGYAFIFSTTGYLGIQGPRRKSELKIDIEGLPKGKSNVDVLCFNLVYFTRSAQFVILSVGIFPFYLLCGYHQELIFSLPGFSGYGWYLTLIQFGYHILFGKIKMLLRQDVRKIPLKTYSCLAITTVTTMGFSNAPQLPHTG